MKKYFNLFDFKQKVDYKIELLSGLTVALALVPEAVAFALIAGLSPLTGLYSAFVMGLVTSVLGGRPGMISGATGAVAIVIVSLALSHGPEYVFATVVLAGMIQLLAGFLRLGKLMRLVPHPVIFGLVNGLAIIIFISQLEQFKDPQGAWLTGKSFLYITRFGDFNHVDHLGFAQVDQRVSCFFGCDYFSFWDGLFFWNRNEDSGRYRFY